MARYVATQRNEFLAAQQWTSPDTSRYEKLGRYAEADSGGVYIDATGQFVPVDPRRHAILFDPERGEVTVYRRSPDTDESRLMSLGRLLGAGLVTGPLGAAGGAALRAGQLGRAGRSDAATTLGSGIGPTERGIAATISGAAKGEAWAVEEAVPGVGANAGLVHKVTKPGKATYPNEGTALFMSHREPVAADVLNTGRPLGLTDDATFAAFKKILREEKAKLPEDTMFAIRGSAVTGNGFDKTAKSHAKEFFDLGRTSDHDVAIVSRTLFEKAREIGVKLQGGNLRTGLLRDEDILDLSLEPLLMQVRALTGRKNTELIIYRSADALNKRGTNIQFDLK